MLLDATFHWKDNRQETRYKNKRIVDELFKETSVLADDDSGQEKIEVTIEKNESGVPGNSAEDAPESEQELRNILEPYKLKFEYFLGVLR